VHESPIFIIVILVIVFGAIGSWIASQQRSTALHSAVQPWSGVVTEGHWLSYPQAQLKFGSTTASLHYTKRGKNSRYTHLSVAFDDPRLRLELYPQSVLSQLRKLLHMQDIEVGSPVFDEAFIITGNDEPLIRDYLNADVQRAMLELAQLNAYFSLDLHLSIGGGILRITKASWLSSEGDLKRFLKLGERTVDALQNARDSGIQFLPPRPTSERGLSNSAHQSDLTTAACRVCGESLQKKIVYCSACRTPHHLDCWQYFGSCSIYGCGQKRYVSRVR
jgi:hypothetical protein